MGVDTHGKLKGRVLAEDILNYIQQKYDPKATMEISKSNYGTNERDYIKQRYDNSGCTLGWSGFIDFFDGKDNRQLFYSYDNTNSYENLDYYANYNLDGMVKSETTYISLGYWNNSVEIIKAIVTEFGGWIDENDCDNEPYYPIIKNPDGTIKPVIRVTMQDIYEKFGGTVIITDLQK